MTARRARQITFRLTEQEYRDLQEFCTVKGAGSMANVMRIAVANLLGNHNNNGAMGVLQSRVIRLDSLHESLRQAVNRLSQLVATDSDQSKN